jgi:hypothetical protein
MWKLKLAGSGVVKVSGCEEESGLRLFDLEILSELLNISKHRAPLTNVQNHNFQRDFGNVKATKAHKGTARLVLARKFITPRSETFLRLG